MCRTYLTQSTWKVGMLTCEIMAKRRGVDLEEFEDVSGVTQPSPNAKLCSVVHGVSPMKKSKTCAYFDGEISDGKSTMRLFGFDCSVRRKLMEGGSGTTLVLSNCEVRKSRHGDQLEVQLQLSA